MNVFVYVDYRQDKETGEEQFETPEVYAKLLKTTINEVKQALSLATT